MQASLRRSTLSASLVVMASLVTATPVMAMGWSPTQSVPEAKNIGQFGTVDRNALMDLEAQVEALRREVADLKDRVEQQDVAAAE